MLLYDSHTHSRHSADAFDEIHELARYAALAGLGGFCVTDHCDCDLPYAAGCVEIFRDCARDALAAREAFAGRLAVTLGIELGQPLGNENIARQALGAADYDFVLLSLHNARGGDDLYEIPFGQIGAEEIHQIVEGYFEYVCESVRLWDDYDALAHLTIPARYIQRKTGRELDLRPFDTMIEEALRTLAERGKALEINVSGMRNGHGDTMPPAWAVRRFRELGGELVTLGSDTHKARTIGGFLDEGARIAREAGFRHAAFYRERKPEMFSL